MTDAQLADVLIGLAADKGADELALSSMRLGALAGDHLAAISDAFDFVDVADLDADTAGAYRAFRNRVNDPFELDTLPDIPVTAAGG